jgi:general secretion pathway protein I
MRPAQYSCEHPGGFTLLEVMFAVAILAIALPVLLGLRNSDIDLHARARAITTATFLAKEKLLEAELTPVLPIGETGGEFTTPSPGTPTTSGIANRAPGFRWKRIVVPTPLDAVREIRIQVLWPRGTNEDMVEVSSFVFQKL